MALSLLEMFQSKSCSYSQSYSAPISFKKKKQTNKNSEKTIQKTTGQMSAHQLYL